jgi:p-aminobenzoyl-glutamate transporter AbgT
MCQQGLICQVLPAQSLCVVAQIGREFRCRAIGKQPGAEHAGEAIEAITKSWAGLAGLLLVFLLIAQFIAYFNFSHMPEVAASQLADVLESLSIGTVWLLVGAIVITAIVNIIIPAAIAKWAILAPIFVPLFIRLGVAPPDRPRRLPCR